MAISALNKLRPKFLVISGNFCNSLPNSPNYSDKVEAFRKSMTRLSDSIPVVYVPGSTDVGGGCIDMESITEYNRRFGADHYGFWFGGMYIYQYIIYTSIYLSIDLLIYQSIYVTFLILNSICLSIRYQVFDCKFYVNDVTIICSILP
jgi:hypothetical protein